MSFRSVLKQLGIRQNSKAELIVLDIDESAISNGTNAGLNEGAQQATLTKNGTGDYTITLNRTARRTLRVIGAVAKTVDLRCAITSESTSAVRIVWEGGGTDTNTDFTIAILANYSEFDR